LFCKGIRLSGKRLSKKEERERYGQERATKEEGTVKNRQDDGKSAHVVEATK